MTENQDLNSGFTSEDLEFIPEYADALLTDLEEAAGEFLNMEIPTQEAFAGFLSELETTREELDRIMLQLDDSDESVQQYKSRMTDILVHVSEGMNIDLVSPAQESVQELQDMGVEVPSDPDDSLESKLTTKAVRDSVHLTLKDAHIDNLEEAWAEAKTRAIRATLIGDYGFLDKEAGEERMDAVLKRRIWSFKSDGKEKGPDKKGVSVLFLDIDFFKIINDTMGHPVGDTIIKKCAELVSKRTRPKDILVRWGGEELVVVLDDVMEGEAIMVAEELRRMVEEEGKKIAKDPEFAEVLAQRKGRVPGCLSVSEGVSFFPDAYEEGDSTEDVREKMVKIADDALYAAKENGRNVVVFTSEGQKYQVIGMKRLPEQDEKTKKWFTKVALLYSRLDDPEGEEVMKKEFTIEGK